MSRNRFLNAEWIQQGASNPAGVARALVDAIDQARKEGIDERTDAACRLIAHQLAFLLGVGEVDRDFTLYCRLGEECREKANNQ
jgi:hypothetical protein